ncbi:EthD family reductase [Candidatus Bathyarchaeota archaeon]|nr:EthD family reductase [Candidatus Bathyarchaeota archaeon]
MTAKIIVLFGKPTDPQLFDKQYWEEHVPIAKQMPGLRKYTVHKVVPPPRGEPAYYQIVELEFDDMASLKNAVASQAGKDSGRHGGKIATGGITFLWAESKEA